MVADQVARLQSGAVRPDKFDFVALKFDGARWGAAALDELSHIKAGPDAASIAPRATRTLAMANRFGVNRPDGTQPTANELADRVAVYPEGRVLPAAFYDMLLGPLAGADAPWCFRSTNGAKCSARFLILRPGDAEAILLLDANASSLFELDTAGEWRKTARVTGATSCAPVRQGIERGEFTLEPHAWPDLVVGNQRLDLSPPVQECDPGP